jgi:hypothetical protein
VAQFDCREQFESGELEPREFDCREQSKSCSGGFSSNQKLGQRFLGWLQVHYGKLAEASGVVVDGCLPLVERTLGELVVEGRTVPVSTFLLNRVSKVL